MIREVPGRAPRIHPDTWIDPSAEVIGDVTIEQGASVWPGAVLLSGEIVGTWRRAKANVTIQPMSIASLRPRKPS
jgi:carbonic anhydrase/acetyltransferase-like protein (isoleucine patch superfamily)